MRYKKLDLNLLVVFDTLMHTRSISRAAEQLNVSQPAISSSLRRLREFFSDEILIAHGKRMLPTAHAERLIGQVRESLAIVDGLIAESSAFDPATTQRSFMLCASDSIATSLFVPLVARLAHEAPNVRLDMLNTDQRSWQQLEQGKIDLVISPEEYAVSDMPTDLLFEEEHVIAGWLENPLFEKGIDEATFLAAGHIQVLLDYNRTVTFSDRQLIKLGKTLRVEMTASSFAIVPQLLVGTQRLALMHARLARSIALRYPIVTAPIPFDFPPMRQVMQYHPARTQDAGLVWLREQLKHQANLS